MVKRPTQFGAYEFAVLSGRRAAQLARGCVPRVAVGLHKITTTAQMEIAELKVVGSFEVPDPTLPAPVVPSA